MTTIEQKLKQILGEFQFQLILLTHEIEQLKKEIEEFKKEKEE